MTTKQAQGIRGLADAALEIDEADPHALARMTFEGLPVELREALAFRAWTDLLKLRLRAGRSGDAHVPAVDALGLVRVYVAGAERRWDFLRDLTITDVEAIAEGYRERAVQNAAYAARYEALANLMRRKRAATVADVGEEAVARMLGLSS